jgi:amino acid transporter
VITLLVITRILLQFSLQHVGVILLRRQRPELNRPFKMPLYPLPPLVAMAGFIFMVANRAHALSGFVAALAIGFSGTLIYLFRANKAGAWPFSQSKSELSGKVR